MEEHPGVEASIDISVVIPTVGRPELGRAIRSVRRQDTRAVVQVVVVNDSADEHAVEGVDADIIVWTGGRHGGGAARNIGVRAATGRWVAFLDDDDEWLPSKLRVQMDAIDRSGDPARNVASGRHVHVRDGMTRTSKPGPARLIGQGERVEAYLFRKRRPHVGRCSMYTSTLMCSRDLALEVPWREDLRRHQDWDWLVRLGQHPGVTFQHVPEVVVRIQTGSAQSISASPDWQSSLSWAAYTLSDDRIFVDFVAAQTLRYALNARSGRGIAAVIGQIMARRTVPSAGPLAIGLMGVVPRRQIEAAMTRGRAPRTPRNLSDSRV